MFWLTTPPITFGELYDPTIAAEVLGISPNDLLQIPPQLVTAGNPNIFITVRDKNAVDRQEGILIENYTN
jgi:predicted PhzF superfamily epimerase YddE/YHI9